VRILQVIPRLRMGGAELVVIALVRGGRSAGHTAGIAASPGPIAEDLGLDPYVLPLLERRPWRVPGGALALRRAVRDFRPDVLHCHGPSMALLASLVTLRGRRVPGLVTFHGVPEEDYATSARILRVAGLPVVACGPGVAAALAESGGDVQATIVNGITPAPAAADRRALEDEWDVGAGQRLVVSVGRLVEQKNHALAIRALVGVPEATLVVLGEGPLAGALDEVARAAGVRDRVVFGGVRPDARSIMAAADAVLFASHWEGLPLVGLEALAAGTPLVGTAVRGIRELLTDGETALLVRPDDAQALGGALRRVLADAELSRRLVEAGRALAASYSEEAMVRHYLELYDSLVGR